MRGNSLICGCRSLVITLASQVIRPALWLTLPLLAVACGFLMDDEAKIERARAALGAQQYSAAIIDAKSVLLNAPENAVAWELLGRSLAANGEFEAAEEHLQRALDLGRPLNDFRLALVQARLETGQAKRALAIADPAQAADDGEAFYLWLYRGDAQYELDKTVDALRSYERAEQMFVDNASARLRAAELFWNEGNFPAAEELTKSALLDDPANLDAHLTLVAILMDRQAWQEAKEQLDHLLATLQLQPMSEGYVLAALAESCLALGEVVAARAATDRVAKLWPQEDPDLGYLRAQVALAEGDYNAAAAGFLAYLVDFPDSEIAMRKLGAAQLGQGLPQQARLNLERALRADPDQLETRQLLARTYLALGEIDEARRVLELALYLDARDATVLSLLGVLNLPSEDAETSNDLYRPALEHLVRGRAGEALKIAQKNISSHRDDARDLNLLGLLELANGQASSAVESFARASMLAPDDNRYRISLARAHLANGAPAEGLDVLEGMGRNEPNADFHVTRRALVIDLNESGNALEGSGLTPLFRWVFDNPDDVSARMMLAQSLVDRGSFADASAHYELLIEQGLEEPEIYNNLAWSYLHLGDDRALEHAEYAYELAPNDGEIVDTLGWILVSRGELENGETLLRDAYTLLPGDAEIAYHLAYVFSRTGAEGEASAMLEEAMHRGTEAEKQAAGELLLELRKGR